MRVRVDAGWRQRLIKEISMSIPKKRKRKKIRKHKLKKRRRKMRYKKR